MVHNSHYPMTHTSLNQNWGHLEKILISEQPSLCRNRWLPYRWTPHFSLSWTQGDPKVRYQFLLDCKVHQYLLVNPPRMGGGGVKIIWSLGIIIIIATFHRRLVTPNGGLVRESLQNAINSGLGTTDSNLPKYMIMILDEYECRCIYDKMTDSIPMLVRPFLFGWHGLARLFFSQEPNEEYWKRNFTKNHTRGHVETPGRFDLIGVSVLPVV